MTEVAYGSLKSMFAEQRPALCAAFLQDVLWAVYRDPDLTASLTMTYENPPHYDVEATFDRQPDGIRSTVRVTDNGDGKPMQTIVTDYFLVDGTWHGQVIESWQPG